MTGGFLSVPTMRPHRCWTVLHVSILAVLLLTLNADNGKSECEDEIKVRRNTVYEALHGKELRINCTFQFCNSSPPSVTWHKLEKTFVLLDVISNSRIRTEWKSFNYLEGISYLIFQNTLINDSGVYRCRSGLIVSHNINVTVNDSVIADDELTNDTQTNNTTSVTNSNSESPEDIWMYVYTAAGIAGFVILVIIISVASMRGCNGKPKKETRADNLYLAVPMVEQPFQQSPRGSPSAPPPSRQSNRRKTPASQPNELPLPRDNEHVYGQIEDDWERQRKTVDEEWSSVVYAALNHQVPARAARPRRPMEESSEYAAIRVKDPTPTRH